MTNNICDKGLLNREVKDLNVSTLKNQLLFRNQINFRPFTFIPLAILVIRYLDII